MFVSLLSVSLVLHFDYMKNYPELVPLVIRWWHSVWSDRMGSDFDSLESQLTESLGAEGFPFHIIGFADGEPVATAALKLHELKNLFPEKHYWLGSVYVAERWRGKSFGSHITQRIIDLGIEKNLPHIYLQTQNLSGGLYAAMGWEPIQTIEILGEDTLLMIKQLEQADA